MLRPTLNIMVLLSLKCLHSKGSCIGHQKAQFRLYLNRLDKTQADSSYVHSKSTVIRGQLPARKTF